MKPLRYGRWDIGGGRRVTPMWMKDEGSYMVEDMRSHVIGALECGCRYEAKLFEGVRYSRFLIRMKKDGVSVIGGLEYEGYLLGCTGLWGVRCDDGMYEVVDGVDVEKVERMG